MNSIGFKYNNINHICQSQGPGVWQCPQSSTAANIQLNCQTDNVNKISCSLPQSTTDLICNTSFEPFNCTLQNTKLQSYLQPLLINNDNDITIICIFMLFLIFVLMGLK